MRGQDEQAEHPACSAPDRRRSNKSIIRLTSDASGGPNRRILHYANTLNTGMRTKEYNEVKIGCEKLALFFEGERAANICFDLCETHRIADSQLFEMLDPRRAELVMKSFANELNQFCYGNAFHRYGKQTVVVGALHNRTAQWHLHIVVGIPDHMTMEDIDAFTQKFAERNSWVKPRRKGAYCEPVRTVLGSLIYNAKYGLDTIIHISK